MIEKTEGSFEGWVILELMGHRKLGGYLKEEAIAGTSFIRIDVIDVAGKSVATQYYSASAIYCISPCTQELAVQFGITHQPAPVTRWELPSSAGTGSSVTDVTHFLDDDEENEDDYG